MARPLQITDETILDALAARPGVTSAEVAETLGIGQSTAAKRLAALEAAGSVRRTPGGREAGRRVPDRWAPLDAPAPLAAGSPVAVCAPAAGDAETDAGDVGGAEAERTEADRAEGDVGVASASGALAPEDGRRLGRGELGSLVRDYLAARPYESFAPVNPELLQQMQRAPL